MHDIQFQTRWEHVLKSGNVWFNEGRYEFRPDTKNTRASLDFRQVNENDFLGELAFVPKPTGHPQRFRDTFAVELLLAGVPPDTVSILLGHSSIRIKERHYAPWTRPRQDKSKPISGLLGATIP